MHLYIHGHTHKCICTHMNTHRYNCTLMHTYLTHFCICTYMPTYPTCRGNYTQTRTHTHTSEGPQPLVLTARLTVKNKRKQSKESNNAVKGYSRDLGDAQRDRGLENKVSLKAKSPKSIPSPNLVTIKGTKNSLPFKLLQSTTPFHWNLYSPHYMEAPVRGGNFTHITVCSQLQGSGNRET